MQPRDLSSHTAYIPGRGHEEVARELDLDPDALLTLASNENALGPSPAAVAAIDSASATVHRYPKAAHTDLTVALADHWHVEPSQIWLANGGDGAIDYLSRAVLEPGDGILVPNPGFAYYAMSAQFHHGTVRTYPMALERDFAIEPAAILDAYDGERMVYITSPHNPSGSTIEPTAVIDLATQLDETLIVVDEAYGEFSDVESVIPHLHDVENVASIRTFSKVYGLAGLRLGYAVVPTSWSTAYAQVNTPFAASEIACRAGLAALDDIEHVDRSVSLAARSRERMREHLAMRTWPSQANFILADVGDATQVTAALESQGILVRDCSSFGLSNCIRITCATDADTHTVVKAVNDEWG